MSDINRIMPEYSMSNALTSFQFKKEMISNDAKVIVIFIEQVQLIITVSIEKFHYVILRSIISVIYQLIYE